MSRIARSYPSRIARYDEASDRISELASTDLA
jgi:hypothetical protein